MRSVVLQRKAIYTRENAAELTENGRGWNFHHEDTQEHLHNLHPYPAKFIPQIPRKAIQTWTASGDLVYDPFAGCGTTLLEASLLGRPSIGTDNNSVAVLVTKAKIASYTRAHLNALRAFALEFDGLLARARPRKRLIPSNKNFLYWFSEDVLWRLSALKNVILSRPEPIRTILLAMFSSIIVRVSYQDSDTRYARISRTITPKDVDRIFKAKLIDIVKRLPEILVPGRASAAIREADARKVSFVKTGTVSLIVTSPPYLNAYDYHKYHRQRIHWIDGNVEFSRDVEIGGHDEFTKRNATPEQYFVDMDACFSEWSRVLKKGGRCFIVLGDAIVTKQPVHVADTVVDLLEKRGVRLEKRWIRELQPTKRSFNVNNSRITHEHMLLFRKR